LRPMEALSWSSCQKCNWTSFSRSLSSWSRTLLLRSVSLTVNSFLLLRIRIYSLWEAQHQFSHQISCFSKDPI
jgi:RES domain-containing protein